MSELLPAPLARPIQSTEIVPCSTEQLPSCVQIGVGPGGGAIVQVKTDRLAVASAVVGMTAVIPVISQVAGIGLGIAGLRRIGRAKRAGYDVPGKGWAWTGIFSSCFALVGWIGMIVALTAVGSTLSGMTGSLDGLKAIEGLTALTP